MHHPVTQKLVQYIQYQATTVNYKINHNDFTN